MKRWMAVLFAASMIAEMFLPAARAHAQAAAPFPEVPLPAPVRRPHAWSYVVLGAGAGLIAASFTLGDRANRAYREYQTATEPDRIELLYDRATRDDRWSSAALLGGEVLIASGLYLRFLRHPQDHSLTLSLHPRRCAVALRF